MARPSILLLPGSSAWPSRLLSWGDRFDVTSCGSPEEARALLGSSRLWAALVVDGAHPAADRDLIAAARKAGAPSVIVDSPTSTLNWNDLGAAAVLTPDFTEEQLEAVVSRGPPASSAGSPKAPVVAVTGPGGTGASTIAMALSQGLAEGHREVLLADLVRHAEQHVLHNLAGDRPSIGDLVEAHRTSAPDPRTLRELAPPVPERGYRVLAGLRRAVGWSSLRPRAVEATISSLRSAFNVVVCDVDPDLEGEAESGSFDVEERNILARTAVAAASAVLVVGGPGVKGTHSVLRVLGELWAHGVAPGRTVVVVNRGDETSVTRLGQALDRLAGRGRHLLHAPSADVEEAILHGRPLPSSIVGPVTEAVGPLLVDTPGEDTWGAPVRIAPGSLGLPVHRDPG